MKHILSLAIPLIVSQLISMALVLTDVWMMARLSVEDLAGGGLGASVYTFVFLVSGSIVGCVANLIAIAYGQSVARPSFGRQQIRFAVKGALILSVVITALASLALNLTDELLVVAKQPVDAIPIATNYLDALKWAMLPTLLLLILRGLTSTFGDAKSVMWMSLATVVLNVPLSYWFAFTLKGGIAGLGWGTTLAATLILFAYGAWVFRQEKYYRFAPWKRVSEYSWRLTLPLLSLGLPIAVASALELSLIYGSTILAGMLGVRALALHQVLLQCLNFSFNINFGFSQAAAILTGKDFGQERFQSIKVTALRSFILVTLISALLAITFSTWPHVIAGMFDFDSSSQNLSNELASIIWVVALCFVVDGWQLLTMNLLRGMKIVNMPMLLTAIGYWVFGLSSAWGLMAHFQLVGVWGGVAIGLAATGLLLIGLLTISFKRSIKPPTATQKSQKHCY